MEHEALAHAAAVVGAFGACGLLLARERLLFLGGLAALVAAEAGLAYALVPDAPSLLTASATRFGALAVGALFGLALAAAFVRYPAAAPVALLVVAPFRLSVGLGSQEAFLLLPLYVVLAAAAAALGYRVVRGGEFPAVPYLIAGPTAALVALSGISLLWAKDLRAGTIELVFFYFPFSVLLSIVALTRPRDWTWRALATGLVAVTSVFAAIGVYQAWSHTEILAKQDVQLANAYSSLFRVTAVFQDPNVYGRHLVLGIVVAPHGSLARAPAPGRRPPRSRPADGSASTSPTRRRASSRSSAPCSWSLCSPATGSRAASSSACRPRSFSPRASWCSPKATATRHSR